MTRPNTGVDRRSVLRNLAAGTAAAVGATGMGSATNGRAPVSRVERDAAVQGLDRPEAVREAFADHEDMLETLAAEGLVEAASAADLTLDPAGDAREMGHENVDAIRQTDGTVTPEIKLTRRTADGRMLTVGVLPETGERWALLGDPDSQDPEILDVTTRACCKCCGLRSECCTSACDDYCYECYCPDSCC